jgi:HEAT repeat protein
VAGAGLGQAIRALVFLIGITVVAMFAREGWGIVQDLLQPASTVAVSSAPAPSLPATLAPAATATPASATGEDAWTPRDLAAARQAVKGNDVARRVVSAEYLGLHGGPRDTAVLVERLKDPDSNVRWKAADAVGRLLSTPAARAAAPAQVKAATAALMAGLQDSDLAARFAAASALAAMEAREATDALLESLANPAGGQAIGAAAALGTLREPRAVPPLIELLSDDTTRWHAAQALGEIGGPAAEGVLLDALRRKDYGIMAGAHAFYLRRGGPGMDGVLLDLLDKTSDLAVANTLIVEGSPALSKAAREWAEGRGFKLVKTADGYRWEQPEAPQ